MYNSRLNINICEHIIDELASSGRRPKPSYWCTAALVCSAWRPRSQYNLFRTVHLRTQSQVDLLVRTFRTNTPLADLVTSLIVGSLRRPNYNPLIWLPLLWEVNKCSALNLTGIDWKRCPALYASSVLREVQRCGSSTITTLEIELSQTIFRPALLLIRALPSLKKLAVHCHTRLYTTSHTFPSKKAACNQLQNLQLWLDSPAVSFPPMPFGANVEKLSIRMLEGGTSDEALKCIRAFQRLKALHVECYIDKGKNARARIKCLLSVLSIAGSGFPDIGDRPPPLPPLQSLAIKLSTNSRSMNYMVDRFGLLDSLCSAEMVEVLDRFSALRNLSFTLYDNTPQHNRQWWEAQLATRLTGRLHSAISVSVIVLKL